MAASSDDGPAGSGPEETASVRLGPLVRRSVHHGALLWLVGTLQFLIAMAVVEIGWSYPYSFTRNVISDLGNTACGPWPDASSPVVCSPWHVAFNGSVILFGVFVVVGTILLKSAFPARRSATAGLGLIGLSGVGGILVGVFPENVWGSGHFAGSVLTFGAGALALLVLSLAMLRDTRWNGYRAYTLISGLVSAAAGVLYLLGHTYALGPGGMERLCAAPLLLWTMLASVHLLYIPAYAPKGVPHT